MHPAEDSLAAGMISLCEAQGVERFVHYSVLHPLVDVPHHRRKLEAEHALLNSRLAYTILQPCRYMQHLNAIWAQVRDHGLHPMPFDSKARFSLVDLQDLAEATAKVLVEPGHDYATYQLAGPQRLSMDDCAAILTGVLGRDVKAIARSDEEFRRGAQAAGMPAARIEGMSVMNAHYTAHGLSGNPNVLRWLLGRWGWRGDQQGQPQRQSLQAGSSPKRKRPRHQLARPTPRAISEASRGMAAKPTNSMFRIQRRRLARASLTCGSFP
jgi:hypothetical protein